jgi:hypothetical protein
MPLTVYGKNLILTSGLPATLYASLHTALPSQGTPNEVVGGSPAYARKLTTLAVAVDGARAVSGLPVTFDVPPSTVAYEGFWDVSSGGNLIAYYDGANETFANQGRADLNTASITITDGAG